MTDPSACAQFQHRILPAIKDVGMKHADAEALALKTSDNFGTC